MAVESKICLIGDIVLDVCLKSKNTPVKVRLGGIVHAARCLWALNIPYTVAYFATSYLDGSIHDYLQKHGCTERIKLGNVVGAPYLFLIEDAKETGDQGYEFILRDSIQIEYDQEALNLLYSKTFSDFLLISGNYNLVELINNLRGRIHVDLANNLSDFTQLDNLSESLCTAFLSTSSNIFRNYFNGSFTAFANLFSKKTKTLILKENRGGSRGISFENKETACAPSQTQPISNSVGVGDAYCAAFISQSENRTFEEAMCFASWIAAEYALTSFPDDFKTNAQRVIKSKISDLVTLGGTLLPWEERNKLNIYLAAPDFDFIQTEPLNKLAENLSYHNFKPRRPIQENGQMEKDAPKARRQELFSKDMALLEECAILIAVLLYDDPGTYIEIGLASAKGIPVIVYDPYRIASNCILTEIPILISHDLDEIISRVFITASNLIYEQK
jgi:hypothetical protein